MSTFMAPEHYGVCTVRTSSPHILHFLQCMVSERPEKEANVCEVCVYMCEVCMYVCICVRCVCMCVCV